MLKEYYSIPIYAFALLSFISIAAGNIALGVATLLFFIYAYKNKLEVPLELLGYFVCICLFVGSLLVSALFSDDLKLGLKTWADMRVWRMMPFLIIVLSVKNALKAKKILGLSMFGVSIGIACLIYQGITGDSRAAGFFGHPMTFAGYLCIYLPLFLICFLEGNIFKRYNWITGLLFFAGCGALVFNGTRGAWIAIAPVILLVLIYYVSKKSLAALICLLLIGCAGIGLSYNKTFMWRINSITSTKYQSNTERVLIWKSAYKMFQDHPVLGVGLGQYKDNYQKKYISPKAKEPKLAHAHSNFMQMLAENGLVGFIGFVSMVGYFIIASFRRFWKTGNPYALMLSSSTLALVLQGLTEYNFGNSAVMKAFWLVTGCLLVLQYSIEKE